MILRDYQTAFVANIRARFAAGDRAVLGVMPTGAGKTPVVAEIGRLANAKGNRTLFVAHTTELVSQAVAKFAAFGIAAEIEQAGKHAADAPVVVASIATMRGARLESWPRDAFGLVIHDEAHRAAAATSRAIHDHFSVAHLLGVTATPARGDGQALGDTYQSLVVGATIGDLTTAGHLVPARVYVPAGALRAGQLAMDPRAAYELHGANRPAVIFCQDVEHAIAVAASMPVPAAAVYGEMPELERKATLARFSAGELKVLTTCSVLVEGWDEPSTAVAILARKFGHVGPFLQAIGRILRPAPGKDHATVVDLGDSVLRHGTPDTEREYSLDGKAIRKSDRLPIRQCTTCGMVSLSTDFCLGCGVEFPIKHRGAPSNANVGVTAIAPKSAPRPMPSQMIVAKYESKCPACSRLVQAGSRVAWVKGSPAIHEVCYFNRRATRVA